MAEIQVHVQGSIYHAGRIGYWLWLGPLDGAKQSWGGRNWHGPHCSPQCRAWWPDGVETPWQ